MAPLAGPAIFLAINIEPIGPFRIERQFGDLEPASRRRDQELTQRIDANDALGDELILVAVDPDGGEFKPIVLPERFGRLGGMTDFPGRFKCNGICRRGNFALGQSMVRAFPKFVLFFVAAFAAWGFAVGSEDGGLGFFRERSSADWRGCLLLAACAQAENDEDGEGNAGSSPEQERPQPGWERLLVLLRDRRATVARRPSLDDPKRGRSFPERSF